MADWHTNTMDDTRPGDVLMVVHDFDARSADELTLRRGDRITLVELDDGFGDGWYLGKHLDSDGTGLFPGVYTTKLPTGSPILRSARPSIRTSGPSRAVVSHSPPGSPITHYAQPVSPTWFKSSTPPGSRHPSVSSSYGIESRYEYGHVPASDVKRITSMASPTTAFQPNLPRSISETIRHARNGEESPVMNETLSVIDEHITDLSTPRHSMMAQDTQVSHDSASDYSSNMEGRQSSLADLDTDEEDPTSSEAQVKRWDHKQTADHLRLLGVEPRHCDIFEEQEITGDVLLDMDQEFIYMKEYDFGVMGHRLKTWHKIRAFQDEIKGSRVPPSTSVASGQQDPSESLERGQSRSGVTGATVPRIPNLMENPGLNFRPLQALQILSLQNAAVPPPLHMQQTPITPARTNSGSPQAAWRTSIGPGSPQSSATSIRKANHSRRHSSIDAGPSLSFDMMQNASRNSMSVHRPSVNRQRSLGSPAPKTNGMINSAMTVNPPGQEEKYMSRLSLSLDPSSVDLDRGYFSGNELDNRKTRHLIRKRDSVVTPAHSRHSSVIEDPRRIIPAVTKHTRVGSADSIRDSVPLVTSLASKAYHSNTFKGRFRSVSSRSPALNSSASGLSPTVTNLKYGSTSSLLTSLKPESEATQSASRLPSLKSKTIPNKARRMIGLRAISDAVTGVEKALVMSPTSIHSPTKESPVHSPSRTGSSTPSATSKSLDIDNTDASSKGTDGATLSQPRKPQSRARTKTKKETSAYVRGLEKKTPTEQRNGSDYSGWMRKKSSSIMTTWKPRLFVLRGRRLSYYYSEDDTEERGVIDISSHKVLVANQDPITTLHATITGATSSPTPVSNAQITGVASEKALATVPAKSASSNTPFFFKLVPPKAGLSRAVQFTKPTVHYFQVDDINIGRRWMGAMMKATIERDLMIMPSSTNKQKTISLSKARARKERPPALKGTEGSTKAVEVGPKSAETGLSIRNLNFDEPSTDRGSQEQSHTRVASLEIMDPSSTSTLSSEANKHAVDRDGVIHN